MGNICTCLNNLTSPDSENLSRANNNDIITNYNNNNHPSRNLTNNENIDKSTIISQKTSINETIQILNTKSDNKSIESNKNTINNINDNIKDLDKLDKLYYSTKPNNAKNKIAVKLHKYITRIITKRKFLKNIKQYKDHGIKLYEKCIENINKSNKLILKAEKLCKIKYSKNGYKQFYINIKKEEEEKMIYKLPEKKLIEDAIIINYINEVDKNINDINWIYKGEINISSIPNGYGIIFKKSGIKEEGYFKDGELKGWGQIIDNKGEIIMGCFDNNKVNSKGMKYSYKDNSLYKGDIKDNKKEGKGEEISNEGIYIGSFHNDKKNGKGKFVYNLNGDVYEGDFKDDLFEGEGHYIYKESGQEYKGEYKNGLMHGKGLYEWSERQYYLGNFVNGIKEGNGEMHWADGRSYIGPFVNGRPQGIGIYDNGINYKGEVEFNNGKLNREYIPRNTESFKTESVQSSSEFKSNNNLFY